MLYRCAGLLAGSVRRLIEEDAGSVRTEFTHINWDELQERLFRFADQESQLAQIVDLTSGLGGLFEVEEC